MESPSMILDASQIVGFRGQTCEGSFLWISKTLGLLPVILPLVASTSINSSRDVMGPFSGSCLRADLTFYGQATTDSHVASCY